MNTPPIATRILIVDDEPDLLDMLLAYFLASKFDAETATDGVDALIAISQRRPDVVLLDVNMPRMNGVEALKAIVKIDSSIALITLTGNAALPVTVQAIHSAAC